MAFIPFKKIIKNCRSFFFTCVAFSRRHFNQIVLVFATIIFLIAYFESLRWPLPGPKATHGIAKGLSLLLGGVLVVHWQQKKKQLKTKSNFLMFIFFISYLVSTVFSLDLETSLLHLWYPFMATLIFCCLSVVPIPKKYFPVVLFFSTLLVFVTFVFSFFSIIFRYSVDNIYYFLFLDHRANQLLDEIRRFGKYASMGPYIMLVPLIMIPLVQKSTSLVQKTLSFFLMLVALLTAVISNNRIDVLVFAIQSAVYLFILNKRQIILFTLPVVFFVWFGLLVTQTYFGFNLEQRILRPEIERDQETIDMRYTYWRTALNNFRNYPLFGTGPNTYNVVSDFPIRRYYVPGASQYTFRLDQGIGIHNVFIERLADTGLFGFLSFMALIIFFVREDVRAMAFLWHDKKSEGLRKYILYALGSWSWILYGITDNGYGAQGFMTFFFLRALLPHIYRHEKK